MPEVTPNTVPVDIPTVATDVLLLVHEPPPASVRAVVELTHTEAVPVIAAGDVLTVTVIRALQPVDNV